MKRIFDQMLEKVMPYRMPSELKQYSKQQLESMEYDMQDIFMLDIEYIPIDPKTYRGVKSEQIIAVRAYKNWFMDIESGKYYQCGSNIKDINKIGFYVTTQRPFKFYCHSEIAHSGIGWNSKLTAGQCRAFINEKAKANQLNMARA